MNENWLEIVDIYNSSDFSAISSKDALSKISAWFRMLGWRKSNGSMRTDVSDKNGITIPIMLYDVSSDKPVLPVFILFHESDATLSNIARICASEFNCHISLYFGANLKMLFCDNEEVLNITSIKFDADNSLGSELFNYLEFSNFSTDKLTSFCTSLLESNKELAKIENAIPNIAINQDLFKRFIKDALVGQGFNEDSVNEVLSDYHFELLKESHQVSASGKAQVKPALSGTRDHTKFSFDGVHFLNKRSFVLQLIRKFIEDNPDVSIEDLEKKFPSKLISKVRGVIRPFEIVEGWAKTNPDIRNRYCMKPEEILALKDGTKIVVYNQWGTHFPKILQIAKSLYNIVSDKPYQYEVSESETVFTNDNPNHKETGILISEKSLQSFFSNK